MENGDMGGEIGEEGARQCPSCNFFHFAEFLIKL